jgi:hypothetical protein
VCFFSAEKLRRRITDEFLLFETSFSDINGGFAVMKSLKGDDYGVS